jgi:tetratricopeptide (TPR) repeat protein
MIELDWDEQKRFKNLQKHGVDFYISCLMFQTSVIQEFDDRRDYGEPRYLGIKQWGDQTLVIAFSISENKIKVISVRKANSHEQRIYLRKKKERITVEEALTRDQTDWQRLEEMTDEELTENALDDPDNPPLQENTQSWELPPGKVLGLNFSPDKVNQAEKSDNHIEHEPGAIANQIKAGSLDSDDAEDCLERGIALENQGDLERAIDHYNCAIALAPDYAKAYQSRGVIFCELEDYVEAVKDLEKAADLYQKQGQEQQHQAIIKLLKKIGRAKGYYKRGIARENQGNYLGAIEDYTQTIGIEPSWALIYFNRAGVQKKIGNFKQAILDYTQAIELSPNWANAYFQRGVTRYGQGDDSGAIEDYNQTIRLDFYHADAYLERGIVRSAQRNHVEAIEDYSHAIRLQLSNPRAYYLRGIVYARQGEPVEAVKDLQQAAHLYQKQGNTEQSQKALQWVNRLNKSS